MKIPIQLQIARRQFLLENLTPCTPRTSAVKLSIVYSATIKTNPPKTTITHLALCRLAWMRVGAALIQAEAGEGGGNGA